VGSPRECTWILGWDGFRVVEVMRDSAEPDSRVRVRVERRGIRRYACSGCGRRTSRVRDQRDRTWHDLPWAAHPVTVVYAQRRVRCRHCGIRTERLEFADPKARVTRRLQQLIGLDCQSMPTSHAAVRHGVSWGAARRAEYAFLRRWDKQRAQQRPRYIGLDEIHRGKSQQFWTVLSDIVHGEVIGLRQERSEAATTALLNEALTPQQRGRVQAVCTDMWWGYVNAVAAVLPKADVVFDKFHVLQHAADALDEVRRREFFRASAALRAVGRGKRWLLLRRWKTVRGSKRRELQELFALNHRLFKAYVLREQLDRLWTYKTPQGVGNFLLGWLKALRWQRLPEMERLGAFLAKHLEGIAAYCFHPVRFGVVESLNTTIKAVIRRARGMRNDAMLLLKLKWATAHPIRSAADLKRFLQPYELHSNR
jgi:transposase